MKSDAFMFSQGITSELKLYLGNMNKESLINSAVPILIS